MSTMGEHEYMTYEQFGRKFYETAVTEERVGDAIASIAGDEFTVGPIGQGPGNIAKVTAKVNVKTPEVTRHLGEFITFDITIPIEMDMVIDLKIDKPRFDVSGEIALHATAVAAEPLLLIIDVHKPKPFDITIHVTSTSMRAELLRVLAGVDAEIKRFIAAHVTEQIESPDSKEAKEIDVATQLEESWTGV